jgi:hypothetical protein
MRPRPTAKVPAILVGPEAKKAKMQRLRVTEAEPVIRPPLCDSLPKYGEGEQRVLFVDAGRFSGVERRKLAQLRVGCVHNAEVCHSLDDHIFEQGALEVELVRGAGRGGVAVKPGDLGVGGVAAPPVEPGGVA